MSNIIITSKTVQPYQTNIYGRSVAFTGTAFFDQGVLIQFLNTKNLDGVYRSTIRRIRTPEMEF